MTVVLILNNFWRKHVRTVHQDVNDKLTGAAERNPVFTTVAERFRPRDTQPPVCCLSVSVFSSTNLLSSVSFFCACLSLGYRYHR